MVLIVAGKDTVAQRCKAAGVSGKTNLTEVNNTCMRDPSPFNFAAFFIFNWRHEKCHLTQDLNVFPSIPDPRTKLETIVRLDSAALNREALSGASGFFEANQAILNANTIDSVNTQTWTMWGRDATNSIWDLLTVRPKILAPGC